MPATGGISILGLAVEATILCNEADGFKLAMHTFLQRKTAIIINWHNCINDHYQSTLRQRKVAIKSGA
ncbi:MAG: hypothetical protein HHJ09_04480 [Glaciimonas sp.]|nr:hypothetical protein [Glaciimonas sp.]